MLHLVNHLREWSGGPGAAISIDLAGQTDRTRARKEVGAAIDRLIKSLGTS